MKDNRKNSVRMRLRQHIMELLHRNPGTELKLPSNEALAKKLNMVRSTAQLELKLLIEEGYLKTKAGIGTFTNPSKGPLAIDNKPLIALMDGDGKTVYYEYSGWKLKASIGEELAKIPATIEDSKIYSSGNKETLSALLDMECSAFVWIRPEKSLKQVIAQLAEKRLVFIARDRIPGANSLEWDDEEFGHHLAQELIRRNRTKLLFIDSFQNSPQHLGIARAFAEAGLNFPKEHYFNTPDARERIIATIKDGYRPDCLMFRHEDGDFIIDRLRELGMDLQQECRLVSIMYKPKRLHEPMLYCPFDFQGFSTKLAEMVARHLKSPGLPPEQIKLALKTEMRLI